MKFAAVAGCMVYAAGCKPAPPQVIPGSDAARSQGEASVKADSVFKIGKLLFEGVKGMRFELVPQGGAAKLGTRGDTLYRDSECVLLGNHRDLVGTGVFRKFALRSKFEEYPAVGNRPAKLAAPDFATDPGAKLFKTRIQEGTRETGANFAGHYTVVEWGCGADCQQLAVVDRISGRILYTQIPFDSQDGHSGDEYRIDSRMLIVNTQVLSENWGYEKGYVADSWRAPAAYVLENGAFLRVE